MSEEINIEPESNKSLFTILSYNLFSFSGAPAGFYFMTLGLFFWETEIGLPAFFYALAYIIYGIWDAVNDPLIGYFSDRPRWYTKRWGRRFPLIIIGSIPISFLVVLLFSDPGIDPVTNVIPLFLYFLILLIIYEFCITLSGINMVALYPQKFRTDRDRRITTGITMALVGVDLLLGMVLPYLFIVPGNKASYLIPALIILALGIPFLIIGIPGIREDEEMIEQVLKSEEKRKTISFFKAMKQVFTNRNYGATIVFHIAFNTLAALALGSTIYIAIFVLGVPPAISAIWMLLYIVVGVITVPIWVILIGKFGAYKILLIGGFGLALSFLPVVLFYNDPMAYLIAFPLAGIFQQALDCSDTPLFANVIDEVVAKEEYRPEGTYQGIRTLILRLAGPLSIIIIATIHVITGFDPNLPVQSDAAKFGIVSHFALIPLILGILGTIGFMLIWNLTEERMKANRAKLRELGL